MIYARRFYEFMRDVVFPSEVGQEEDSEESED